MANSSDYKNYGSSYSSQTSEVVSSENMYETNQKNLDEKLKSFDSDVEKHQNYKNSLKSEEKALNDLKSAKASEEAATTAALNAEKQANKERLNAIDNAEKAARDAQVAKNQSGMAEIAVKDAERDYRKLRNKHPNFSDFSEEEQEELREKFKELDEAKNNAKKAKDNAEKAAIMAEQAKENVEQTQANYDAAFKNSEAQIEKLNKIAKDTEEQEKKLQDLKDNPVLEPGYTKESIEYAKVQLKNMKNDSLGAMFSQRRIEEKRKNGELNESNYAESNLIDIRNLPGGKNFRHIGNLYGRMMDGIDLSPARSFFLTDYKFAESLTLNDDLLLNKNVQKIIINEFQPYETISPADIFSGIGDFVMNLINSTVGMLAAPVVKGAGKLLTNQLINIYMKDTEKLYGNGATRKSEYFTSDPVQVVQNMFMGGKWLNTYELPFFGGQYLKTSYSNNWTTGDSAGFMGSSLAGDGDKQVGMKMMGIDFPSNPKFKAKMDQGRDPIQLEFYLINSNNDWLERNFQFLNAIYAGTNWLHLKYCFIRPPNVYHVLCPGRFQIYWAAMDITVTFEGKLRKNSVVSNKLKNYSKAITDDMLWPEAWKLNINLRDLTPNNFNLYAEYYLHGLKTEELASFDQDPKTDLIDSVASLIGYLSGMIHGEIGSAVINEVKDAFGVDDESGKSGRDRLSSMVSNFIDSFNVDGDKKPEE